MHNKCRFANQTVCVSTCSIDIHYHNCHFVQGLIGAPVASGESGQRNASQLPKIESDDINSMTSESNLIKVSQPLSKLQHETASVIADYQTHVYRVEP